MYQAIIIGGGPSDLTAAVATSEQNDNALLIEKKKGLGRKPRISGGGRYNVTNRLPYAEVIKNILGDGKFLYSPFSIFDNESIIGFFESRGAKLKEENHGRMSSISDKAQDVVGTLVTTIENQHMTTKKEETVSRIEVNTSQAFTIHTQNNSYESHSLVIITGGTSAPQTGSTGDGYKFTQDSGHTAIELFPTEVPITLAGSFIKSNRLKDLSSEDVELSILKKNGKKHIGHQMDTLFAHFGISGPAVSGCNQFIYEKQKNQKTRHISMAIDTLPESNHKQLKQYITSLLSDTPDKIIKNNLYELIEGRYLLLMLEQVEIDENTTSHHLSNQRLNDLVNMFKGFVFKVNGTLSIDEAFITGSDVLLREIRLRTMMPKLAPGLFLYSEVLDIHGYIGGYNTISVLVTGHVTGLYAGHYSHTSVE